MKLLKSKETIGLIIISVIVALTAIAIKLIDSSAEVSTTQISEELIERDSVVGKELQLFDPNTADYELLISVGMTRLEALSIIRLREAGKVYRFREDILSSHAISDSLYLALEPYITIAEQFQYKPKSQNSYSTPKSYERTKRVKPTPLPLSPFRVDSVTARYLAATQLLTPAQAQVFINYRDSYSVTNHSQLRECFVVGDSIASIIEQYIIYPEPAQAAVIDINTADSATLRSVRGIGSKSVVAIIDYRTRLGGFHSLEQLAELKEVTESNYEKIISQIICNNYDISKIDVNFAAANSMSNHPYITDRSLRKLVKVKTLKGGWSTVEEMIQDDIFTQEEATKLRPYLEFTEPEQISEF